MITDQIGLHSVLLPLQILQENEHLQYIICSTNDNEIYENEPLSERNLRENTEQKDKYIFLKLT